MGLENAEKAIVMTNDDIQILIWFVLFLICFLIIYFVPYMVAKIRKRANTTAILVLNIFLGWTYLGWVLALVWAVSEEGKENFKF